MLGGILTTAVLSEIRHPDIKEPGCPPDCRICAEVCPVNAILVDKKQVQNYALFELYGTDTQCLE